MKNAFDVKAAMRTTLKVESGEVNARFNAADSALLSHPQGLAVAPLLNSSADPMSRSSDEETLCVDIDVVHDNPFNARKIYVADRITQLSASIATHGQLAACLAVPHPDQHGSFQLVDGHYRKKALLAAGKTKIELKILKPLTKSGQYKLSWVANHERSPQTALDNALSWQKLLDQGVVAAREEIAEMLGLAPSLITKTLALLKLPTSAIARIQENPEKFGVSMGYELSLLANKVPEEQLLAVVAQVVEEDWSSRELETYRKKTEQAGNRKPTEVSRQYKIRSDSAQIGVIKDWDSGKVLLEVTLTDPRERLELVELLKGRFSLGSGTPLPNEK